MATGIIDCMVNRIKRFIKNREEKIIQYIKIKDFCKKNSLVWLDDVPMYSENNENIFIINTLHNMYEFLYETILFAQGMNVSKKNNIWVLNAKKALLEREVCDSFGVKELSLYKHSLRRWFHCLYLTVKLLIDIRKGRDILKYEYKGILIGPSIYDTILVRSGRCTFDCSINIDIIKIIFHAIILTEELMELFEKNYPHICIVMEEAYEAEIYRRVVNHYGGKILWVNTMLKEYIDMEGKNTVHYDDAVKREIKEALNKIDEEENYVQKVDNILREYYENGNFSGMKGRTFTGDAIKGKQIVSKDEICNRLHLNMMKKNVFVFAHCMTDGPHACTELLYRDYYVWLEQTLKVAKNVNDVNWIVKLHPDRFRRNGQEKIDTDKIISMYSGYDNIYFYPDEYSLASVVNLADIIVTARGKVGEELSCYGIPVITAGQPCYSVWGYTYTYDTVEEYEERLREVCIIEKLSKEKVLLAKKVFWAHSISADEFEKDRIMSLILEANMKRRKKGYTIRKVNIDFLDRVSQKECLNMMKKSSLYIKGRKYMNK